MVLRTDAVVGGATVMMGLAEPRKRAYFAHLQDCRPRGSWSGLAEEHYLPLDRREALPCLTAPGGSSEQSSLLGLVALTSTL